MSGGMRVTVLGAGAVGGWLAAGLARHLGIEAPVTAGVHGLVSLPARAQEGKG